MSEVATLKLRTPDGTVVVLKTGLSKDHACAMAAKLDAALASFHFPGVGATVSVRTELTVDCR